MCVAVIYLLTALPRLKRGKRTPSETMKPLLSELVLLIRFLGQNADLEDSRALVAAVSYLVLSLGPWIAIDGVDRTAASVGVCGRFSVMVLNSSRKPFTVSRFPHWKCVLRV